MRPRPGLSNFGTKRISENGLAPDTTPSSAIVGVFLLSCVGIGFVVHWMLGTLLSFFAQFWITLGLALIVSALAFSWMAKREKVAAQKRNIANISLAAKFEDREIEARRARAAKSGKTYK